MDNKADIKFVNTSSEVKTLMVKLSKSGLNAGAKVVKKKLVENTHKRTGALSKQIGSWSKINKGTGQPECLVGYYSWQKQKQRGKVPSHANAAWLESGTKMHKIEAGKISSRGGILKRTESKALGPGGIYGKSVEHKGSAGYNTLKDTILETTDDMKKAQEVYLAELSKTIEEAGAKVVEGEDDEGV